jgi:hypothetical protein
MSDLRVLGPAVYLVALLASAAPCPAQPLSPRDELLRLVPPDSGLCFVVTDLRHHAARWHKSEWVAALTRSTLGQAVAATPELAALRKFQDDLSARLGVDWRTFRDDIIGEALVFAYQPGPANNPRGEKGIVLVHVPQPESLGRLIDNLNRAQQQSGELKELEVREHRGSKYMCRVAVKESQYYFRDGPVFAYTAQEELIKWVIDKRRSDGNDRPRLAEYLRRAGGERAVASILVNPRAFDVALEQQAAGLRGVDGTVFRSFVDLWNALDTVVLSCTAEDNLECKLTMLASEHKLPAAARASFMHRPQSSDLWKRFPDNALVAVALRLDATELARALRELAPPEARQALQDSLQPLAALVGIDLARDLAPNLGPDCGFCVLPAAGANKLPQGLAALAVRPGSKGVALDQTLYRGIQILAGFALVDFNRRNPNTPMRVATLSQDGVEVKYLTNDTLFPPGFQPACALKDGYLLLATSPDAIARFRQAAGVTAPGAVGEAPLVRIAPREIAKMLRQHRELVVKDALRDASSAAAAAKALVSALSVLDLLDRIEIARAGGSGQASLVLRVRPALKK